MLNNNQMEIVNVLANSGHTLKEWCNCGKDNMETDVYFEDNIFDHCKKHHYRCRNCGCVTQVG